MNGTRQLSSCADDVNIVGKHRYHTEKTEALLDASKEVGQKRIQRKISIG
jgi:hypothetical protein